MADQLKNVGSAGGVANQLSQIQGSGSAAKLGSDPSFWTQQLGCRMDQPDIREGLDSYDAATRQKTMAGLVSWGEAHGLSEKQVRAAIAERDERVGLSPRDPESRDHDLACVANQPIDIFKKFMSAHPTWRQNLQTPKALGPSIGAPIHRGRIGSDD